MAVKTEAERIKALQDLCDQLDTLQKQAEEICKTASSEIRRAQLAGQRDRRTRTKKVKRDRRR